MKITSTDDIYDFKEGTDLNYFQALGMALGNLSIDVGGKLIPKLKESRPEFSETIISKAMIEATFNDFLTPYLDYVSSYCKDEGFNLNKKEIVLVIAKVILSHLERTKEEGEKNDGSD